MVLSGVFIKLYIRYTSFTMDKVKLKWKYTPIGIINIYHSIIFAFLFGMFPLDLSQ